MSIITCSIISTPKSVFEDNIIFRYYEDGLLLTYDSSAEALKALTYDQFKSPQGHILSVQMIDNNWQTRVMVILDTIARQESSQVIAPN